MLPSSLLLSLHPEPLPGYKFCVFVQNIPLGFSRVTNIEESIETEPLQEGGVNDRVYSLCRPQSGERTMVFERGAGGQNFALSAASLRLMVGQRLPEDVIIMVLDRNGAPGRVFFLHGAVVRKCTYSDLDAMSGQLQIDRFELAYETLECL